MKIRTAAALAATLAALGAAPPASAARTEQHRYLANPGVSMCGREALPSLGGACLGLQPTDSTLRVTIDDDHVEAVNAVVTFYRPAGEMGTFTMLERFGRTEFCTDSGELTIPDGAIYADVRLPSTASELTFTAGSTAVELLGGNGQTRPCPGAVGGVAGTITATFE